jgi:hypothetical protein
VITYWQLCSFNSTICSRSWEHGHCRFRYLLLFFLPPHLYARDVCFLYFVYFCKRTKFVRTFKNSTSKVLGDEVDAYKLHQDLILKTLNLDCHISAAGPGVSFFFHGAIILGLRTTFG